MNVVNDVVAWAHQSQLVDNRLLAVGFLFAAYGLGQVLGAIWRTIR